jgi:hypothetical protein
MAYVLGQMLASGYTQASFNVVDEMTGLRGVPSISGTQGLYEFPALPLGDHRLRFAMQATDASTSGPATLVGGPLDFALNDGDQQTTKTLNPVVLHPASPDTQGQLTFRLRVLGGTVQAKDLQVELEDLTAGVTVVPASPRPDSTGLVSVPVHEGLFTVSVSAADPAGLIFPGDLTAVVLGDQETDLGDVYVISEATAARAQADCRSDADCGGGECQAGLCAGLTVQGTGPGVISPSVDPCDISVSCSAGDTCSGTSHCALSTSGAGYCIPPCTVCTPDGATTLIGACP